MQGTDQPNKALVIDSDLGHRGLLEQLLNEYGYQVKGVGEVQEAAQLFKKEDFSLVVSELEVSGSNGMEILDLVRHLGSKAKVVLITPRGGAEIYIKARARGAFDCIDKTLESSALREVIAAARS